MQPLVTGPNVRVPGKLARSPAYCPKVSFSKSHYIKSMHSSAEARPGPAFTESTHYGTPYSVFRTLSPTAQRPPPEHLLGLSERADS